MQLQNFQKTVYFSKKSNIFGWFQLVFHNFTGLVVLSLIFTVTSLPVITLPASFFALYKTVQNIVYDEPTDFIKHYLKCFANGFKKHYFTSFMLILFRFLSLASFIIYYLWSSGNKLFLITASISLCVRILSNFISMRFFTKTGEPDRKSGIELIIHSALLAMANLKNTLCAYFIEFILLALSVMLFPYGIIIFAAFLPSFSALAAVYFSVQTKNPPD